MSPGKRRCRCPGALPRSGRRAPVWCPVTGGNPDTRRKKTFCLGHRRFRSTTGPPGHAKFVAPERRNAAGDLRGFDDQRNFAHRMPHCEEIRKRCHGPGFVPALVITLVKPAAPWPISAGMTPERLDFLHGIYVKIREGSAPFFRTRDVHAVHGKNGISTLPLTANCWVKFAAPLVSVMVPAASNSNWLKSRSFSGNSDTLGLERVSPPLPCAAAPFSLS